MSQNGTWSQSYQGEYLFQTENENNQKSPNEYDQQNESNLSAEHGSLEHERNKQNAKQELQKRVEQLSLQLTSFQSHGPVTDIVLTLFSADETMVPVPPTVQELMEKLQEQNFNHLVSISMQLGDVMMYYGTLAQFAATIPSKYMQEYGTSVETLVSEYFPINTRGLTINFTQIKRLCADCFGGEEPLERSLLQTLFNRAAYLQATFVCDFCLRNGEKSESYLIDKFVQEYAFASVDWTTINASLYEKPEYKFKDGNPKVLNYLGLLIFIQLLSFRIVQDTFPKYFYQCSNFCYSKEEVLSYSQRIEGKEVDGVGFQPQSSERNNVTASLNNQMQHNQFKSNVQYIQVGNLAKELKVNTHAMGWKVAYIFACMIDSIILPKGKKFGFNESSTLMNTALFLDKKDKLDFSSRLNTTKKLKLKQLQTNPLLQECPNRNECLQVYSLYESQLDKYINTIKGMNKNLNKDMVYRALKDAAIIQQISAQFVYEYMLRNHTNFDKYFVPELTKEQLINCIFVGANLAFARHPYNVQLKTPDQRFKYAINNILKNLK